MKVTIDRNICSAALNTCEHCFSFFADHPLGVDRYCIVEQVDDGKADMLTLTLRTDGAERTVVLDEEKRKLVTTEGWASLVDFVPDFYRA